MPFSASGKTTADFTLSEKADTYHLMSASYFTNKSNVTYECRLNAVALDKPVHLIVRIYADKSCDYSLSDV